MRDPFLQAAIDEAKQGWPRAEFRLDRSSCTMARSSVGGHNMRVQKGDPLLHGEMSAVSGCGRQPASVYRECILYTTLSPCPMCSGTALLYKIPEIVIAENVTFSGGRIG